MTIQNFAKNALNLIKKPVIGLGMTAMTMAGLSNNAAAQSNEKKEIWAGYTGASIVPGVGANLTWGGIVPFPLTRNHLLVNPYINMAGRSTSVAYSGPNAYWTASQRNTTAGVTAIVGVDSQFGAEKQSFVYGGVMGDARVHPGGYNNALDYADYSAGLFGMASIKIGNLGKKTSINANAMFKSRILNHDNQRSVAEFMQNVGMITPEERRIRNEFIISLGLNF